MATQVQPTGDLNHMSLVDAVAAESGVHPDTVKAVLRAAFDVIGRTTAGGFKVTVTNFGAWRRKTVPYTRNPQTGEPAGPSAYVAFRSTGRLSAWARSGTAGATLAKSPKTGSES
jgi:nucleoid DNA-binding protein